MKIALVLGTRPEIIKMAPLIRACQKSETDFFVIHSNQHYSREMDALIFEDLELPKPEYNLEVGSGDHGEQTGKILQRIEQVFKKENPTHVIVQGDTNTTLAGALAARKLAIPVGHLEAGLRSFDPRMPEETNRTLVDHMSDFCFTPTPETEKHLHKEGISDKKIHCIGNTVTDAVLQHITIAEKKSTILSKLNLSEKKFVLVTAHRAENIDEPAKLQDFINTFDQIATLHNLPIIFPIHPRTKKNLTQNNIDLPDSITELEPLGYLDMLTLIKNAQFVVTDSGGLQEEACILQTKCITIRDNTERPETVAVGGNIIAGTTPDSILHAVEEMTNRQVTWSNPFGDGTTAEKCIKILHENQLPTNTNPTSPQNEAASPQYETASTTKTNAAASTATAASKTACVIGLGYMGLPTASLLATHGYQVIGVDINEEKIANINDGICPFDEPGLPELLTEAHKTGNLSAQKEVPKADIYIIAVPTPEKDQQIDLTYLLAATENLAPAIQDDNLVIIESTIAPNVCRDKIKPILDKSGAKYHLAHCPERAIPGNTLHELIHNDRIIGGLTPEAAKLSEEIYKKFVRGQIFLTNATTAETCKLLENTYRDVNIALANEFSKIAEDLGINIWEAIEYSNKHPRVNILNPGPGVGGHCIAVDPWFLIQSTKNAKLIPIAREINDSMPAKVVELIESATEVSNVLVGILGTAYKPNVDDARETPATHVINLLKEKNYELLVTDPYVKNHPAQNATLDETLSKSSVIAIITDHDVYQEINFSNYPNIKSIIDTRNCIDPTKFPDKQVITLGNYKKTPSCSNSFS